MEIKLPSEEETENVRELYLKNSVKCSLLSLSSGSSVHVLHAQHTRQWPRPPFRAAQSRQAACVSVEVGEKENVTVKLALDRKLVLVGPTNYKHHGRCFLT
jgi:hypothetical protein